MQRLMLSAIAAFAIGVAPLSVNDRPLSATGSVGRATTAVWASAITLPNGQRHTLYTPGGLHVTLYASGLSSARFMARGPHGVVFIGSWGAGTVSVLLPLAGRTPRARVATLLSGLTVPHSVAYQAGRLYVAQEDRLISYTYDAAHVALRDPRTLVDGLPTGGRHLTRTLVVGPNGLLYLSIGSSCNECADLPTRALIMRYRPDGSGGTVYARGLRNAVGLAWQPGANRLWAADNGEDSLGDTLPPDEIDIIHRGGNYGWPYCYSNGYADPTLSSAPGYCAQTINPTVLLPAHAAPLGIAFLNGSSLPLRFRSALAVAYHGSAYRSQLVGYSVAYLHVQGTVGSAPQDLVTGWLDGGTVWGRPVGVLVAPDGALLISDDLAGVVYRVAAGSSP